MVSRETLTARRRDLGRCKGDSDIRVGFSAVAHADGKRRRAVSARPAWRELLLSAVSGPEPVSSRQGQPRARGDGSGAPSGAEEPSARPEPLSRETSARPWFAPSLQCAGRAASGCRAAGGWSLRREPSVSDESPSNSRRLAPGVLFLEATAALSCFGVRRHPPSLGSLRGRGSSGFGSRCRSSRADHRALPRALRSRPERARLLEASGGGSSVAARRHGSWRRALAGRLERIRSSSPEALAGSPGSSIDLGLWEHSGIALGRTSS